MDSSKTPNAAPVHGIVRPLSYDRIGDILQSAYDSEINVSLSWFWDAGVEAKVFTMDSTGERWRFSETFDNKDRKAVGSAVRWVIEMILKHDPSSEFARRWNAGDSC